MNENHLTQQGLILWLNEKKDIHADTARVHAWIKLGMPTIPGGKKPRFNGPRCYAWIIGNQEQDPLTLEVRDRMVARRYGVTA